MNSLNLQFWIPIGISIVLAIWNFFQQVKLEELKKNKEKQLLVHKLQFDKEFNIYNEIWNNLVELRNITSQLRPEGDFHEPEKTYYEIIKERLSTAIQIGNKTITIVENYKPFYSKGVYEQLQNVITIIKTEIIAIQHEDRNRKEYWEKGKNNVQCLITLTDKVCEEIRTRIGNIEN